MNEDKIMDQSALAESVGDNIAYRFFDYFLVKPLDPIKVTKEFVKPVSNNAPTKDANGVEAKDFEDVETEVKEVDSDYRKGVVIKTPLYYDSPKFDGEKVPAVGDVVIFRDTAGMRFDLLKDSRLLRMFDLLGIEK